MQVADIIRLRMSQLGMDIQELSDRTFMDKSMIDDLLKNKISLKELDYIDIEFLESGLYCLPGYLTDKSVRESDILYNINDVSNVKANKVKVLIQSMLHDLEFMESLL